MAYPANGSTFRFGVFDFDPQTYVLRKNGRPLKLQPQPAKVLALLVAQPNQLVSREELRQRIWGNELYGDFEHALNVCISQLRAVLDDDVESPRYIETVPRSGYLFVAPVEENALASAPATNQAATTGPKRKLLLQVSAACLLLLACVTVAYVRGKRSTALGPRSFHRLTYGRGIIYSARFAPDGQIVYDASWDNKPIHIFTTRAGFSQTMPLDLSSAHLLGISATGELALTLNGYPEFYPVFLRGTLARAPMAGGAPRQILEDVRWADWDRHGELAVVHHLNGRSRLEYPVGNVLYENAGWISDIRFSPRNDFIAFADHPIWAEDRGSIAIVDLRGQEKILSTGWESARGLAWSAGGDEIWFSAAKSGERRDLLAVDLHGRQRTLLQIPGGVTLHDISPDGRVLLTVDNERIGTIALTPASERDLSWLDITYPLAISPDGKEILLDEQSEQAGSDYWVGLRSIEGSPPVRLGEGWGGDFSPDGKWTATSMNSIPEATFLLPIGAGERKELRHQGIRVSSYLTWFMPNGKSVVFSGIESGHLPRSYIQSLQGGPAHAVTPEGLVGRLPSPNGRYLVARQPDQLSVLYDIKQGVSRSLPEKTSKSLPAGWSRDSRYLYMYTRTGPPSQIWRLEISSGQEKLVMQLAPTDPAGILEIFQVHMTPDEKTFVYAYDRYLSELYVVDGLR